ncbi:MAG: PASTA domain-containing protein [Cyclobacteriaceae bacterium]|jgi:beta-lactam-binding protein with PASTA domain|nr:PASTA domain-containing protein [Cyclobacteriaceae bacterium]
MKLPPFFKKDTVGGMLAHVGIALGIFLIIAIAYFYVYLPNVTDHGKAWVVPDLSGLSAQEAEARLTESGLRFAVNDSAYQEDMPPLTVLRQFPRAGAHVKHNRMIFVSINRFDAPQLPMPDLMEKSLIHAEAVLRSSELRKGRTLYQPSPFRDFVIEARYAGKKVQPGMRVPKGATIDLVVGDGNGPADFTVGSVLGDSYERALLKLANWNLLLGEVEIPEGIDTTGVESFVFKQLPEPGDSVRVGDAVRLWIAPRGYKPAPDEDEELQP